MTNWLQKIKKGVVVLLAFFGVLAILAIVFFSTSLRPSAFKSASIAPGYSDYYAAPSSGGAGEFSQEMGSTESYREINSGNQTSQNSAIDRKVIKNGSLSLIVGKAEEAAEKLKGIATQFKGFINSANIYEVADGMKTGSVTIRLPADQFDAAVAEIKKLAIKVERENLSASDVTDQFVDLEARLRNLKAGESQFLEIMKRAVTVEETLKVQRELNSVRGQIEQVQGQLTYLSRQIDMSTITISLTSEADVEVFGFRWRPLFTIKQAFRNMVTGLAGYIDSIVRILFYLPVLILWLGTLLLAIILGWRFSHWIWKRYFATS